eukprot:scaffold3450_cov114-Cylindrotheca_fusiformis.AAC.3
MSWRRYWDLREIGMLTKILYRGRNMHCAIHLWSVPMALMLVRNIGGCMVPSFLPNALVSPEGEAT